MKKIFFLIAVLFNINSTFAQIDTLSTTADKSATVSALCTAQEEVIKEILADLYASDGKIDIIKAYEEKIRPRIGKCLKTDMIETGIKIKNNALEGKFKKIRLSFEKPSDNKFKVSGKVKRKYKKAYKNFKKSFVDDRKGKTLDVIFSEKELSKKIDRVAKAMTREFKKNVRKISK